MKLRFLSSNPHKTAEVQAILGAVGAHIVGVSHKIDEIQTTDVRALVHDKCVKAFRAVGRPLFVEHTGLHLKALNGFPGGLTQVFWDTVGADKFADLFGGSSTQPVLARTTIGYCDGRQVNYFEGEIAGSIPPAPCGNRAFQWDCVFIPDGYEKTFAEMTPDEKNAISMRRLALNDFARYLRNHHEHR